MKSLQKYSERINSLIALADKTLATTKYPVGIGIIKVDKELFNELRTASLSFIKNLYGDNHPYFKDFDKYILNAELTSPHSLKQSKL